MLVLGAIVLPAVTALLARAWVQRDERATSTVVLGVTTLLFVLWFAGRADEYVSEAFISGGAVVLIIVALGVLRRRGLRRAELADV